MRWLCVGVLSAACLGQALSQCDPTPLGSISGFAWDVEPLGAHIIATDYYGPVSIWEMGQAAELSRVAQIPIVARGVELDGQRAFFALGDEGVAVYDMSDPATPVELSQFQAHGHVVDLAVESDTLIVVGNDGVYLYDIQNVASPVFLASMWVGAEFVSVTVDQGFALVQDNFEVAAVLDITVPSTPQHTAAVYGTYDTIEMTSTLQGSTVFVASTGYNSVGAVLCAYELDASGNTTLLSETQIPELRFVGSVRGVSVQDGVLALTGHDDFDTPCPTLLTFDISDPAAPVATAVVPIQGDGGLTRIDSGSVYIAAREGGVQVFDLSNPQLPVRVVHVGGYPGIANDVTIADGKAYVADSLAGLKIIDVSDPTSLAPLGSADTPSEARSVAVSDGLACVASYREPMQIFDVTNPLAPVLVSEFTLQGTSVMDVALVAGRVFAVSSGFTLVMLDLTDPESPLILSTTPNAGGSGSTYGRIAIDGDLVFVTGHTFTGVFDVSNLLSPMLAGTVLAGVTGQPYYADIEAADGMAYITGGQDGFYIVDATNPQSPQVVSHIDIGYAYSVALSGNTAVVNWFGSGLVVYDVSDPANPVSIGANTDALTAFYAESGMEFDGDRLFAALHHEGLHSFTLTGCAPCGTADLAAPLGVIDFTDVIAFLVAFGEANAEADLAPPFGIFDFSDLLAFLAAFAAGCP